MEGDEVRVRDVEQGAELLLEPPDRDRVGLPHRLHRHDHLALQVAGAVDDPHPALAEDVDDLVMIELRPGRPRRGRVAAGDSAVLPAASSPLPADPRGLRPDGPVDLEEVGERLGEVGEPRLVLGQRGRLPRLLAEEDLVIDQVEEPFGVVAEAGV